MEGHVYMMNHEGVCILRLVGEIRYPWAQAMEVFLEHMEDEAPLSHVLVDAGQSTMIDSTALGELARIALKAQALLGKKPVFYSTHPDIRKIMLSLAFEQVFDMQEDLDLPKIDPKLIQEIHCHSESQAQTSARVLECHRVLAKMSEENRQRFEMVIKQLEQEGKK